MPRSLLGFIAALLFSAGAAAQAPDFPAWLGELRQDARAAGIGETTITAALSGVEPIPRVIELDRRQPEFTLSFRQYLDRMVSPERVARGRDRFEQHKAVLEEVGRRYGVQPRFIVALWGMETDFGRLTGGFPVIGALVSLAYDGRRSAYFRKELLNALRIADSGQIAPARMIGSWAGAMGQCQFMPSSYLRFAQDFDGDGRKDIWSTLPDVFASAANYLAGSGWNGDETWGREVSLPPGLEPALIGLEVRKPLADWAALGVRRSDGGALPGAALEASLVRPDADAPAFLVYENFRSLMKWNRSVFFAVAAGNLADRLATR